MVVETERQAVGIALVLSYYSASQATMPFKNVQIY